MRSNIEQEPHGAAQTAADRWNAVVALKGATTVLADAGRPNCGNTRAAMPAWPSPGSGDTLAGIIAGAAGSRRFAGTGCGLGRSAARGRRRTTGAALRPAGLPGA
ncbi:NAD(P)H-hydrate dehydratase [Massilia eburnea]|uniref:NAD(P)H-hydrate dehydratase n=1 Tax=Massilia eburnea TaxID=1776165 RepID=UPI003D6BB5CA